MACYLNNAAEGWPKAPGVRGAVLAGFDHPSREPGRGAGAEEPIPQRCRQRLACLLGANDPSRIVFAMNATQALNVAILGLELRPGELVVASVNEHNSVLRPLERLRREAGIQVRLVGCDGEGRLNEDEYRVALQQEPKLVVLSHVSNVTGHISDIEAFFSIAKKAGSLTLLDASQSVGYLDLCVARLHADMVAFNGHKGLHGPTGTGVLYVAEGLELHQTLVGGSGVRSDLALHPPEMPLRLEAGTPNLAGLAGLDAALVWWEENAAAQRQRAGARALQLESGLRSVPGLRLFRGAGASAGVFSFQLPGWTVADLGYCLQESFGVICRSGLHCAPLIHAAIGSAPEGTVRFSVSGYTTEEEVGMAVDAVRKVSECAS